MTLRCLRHVSGLVVLLFCAWVAAGCNQRVTPQNDEGEKRSGQNVTSRNKGNDSGVRLMTLDPGHFHAALIQKEAYKGVSDTVHVYAPLGFDLTEHLNRIARFNLRSDKPTNWHLEVHTGPNSLDRMLADRPGNVVVLSGKNRGKIDKLKASVDAGLNVLADKPWIIEAGDFPKLEAALDKAQRENLIAYDIMTERSEVTTALQRELIHDASVFGEIIKGSEEEPAVIMKSIHNILKVVAGAPNIRPAWFFDVREQGEGLSDVGTHLVDLVQWMLFPDKPVDYQRDVEVLRATRWPTRLTLDQFKRVTNETSFPAFLSADINKTGGEHLELMANGQMGYKLKGIYSDLTVLWNYETPEGGDTHTASFRGTKSRIEVRQGQKEKFRPELYVVPIAMQDKSAIEAAIKSRVSALQSRFSGIGYEPRGAEYLITIPDSFRVGHEAHFGEVTSRFLEYLNNPARLPTWERANMLAKYFTTTKAVELSRKNALGSGDVAKQEVEKQEVAKQRSKK